MKDLKGKSRWVDRAYEDDKQTYTLQRAKDGEVLEEGTHYMSWDKDRSKGGKGYVVYPTIREDKASKDLRYIPEEAQEIAHEKGDALRYRTKRAAAKASEYGYKKHSNFDKETKKEAKKSWKAARKTKYWKDIDF